MASPKARYAVTFQDKAIPSAETADLLKINIAMVKNASETLRSAEAVTEADVLHFPELGVAYIELTAEEADGLAARAEVLQVRRAKTVTARPLLPPSIAAAAPTRRFEAVAEPIPWNISLVRANEVWGRVTGAGVRVGIIDSGIDRSHPDLTVVDGACFVPGQTDWDDTQDGHGTACAGIVGARRNDQGVVGVAPECDLYALKVSSGGRANTDWLLAAMMWAAEKQLDVVSISLWDDNGADSADEPAWFDMSRGAELLLNNGCLVVGIAGNSGDFANPWVTNPARAEGIVAVGSVNADSAWSSFSSYGPDELGERQSVELSAPGANVRSTWRGGTYADALFGTSFACPHVTGAAALLKQLHPTWSPHEIRARLKQTADDLLTAGRDAKTGWGLLNCYRAVTDPIAPDRVVNEMSGRVASIGRLNEAYVIRFAGAVTIRDWESTHEVPDAVLVVSPLVTTSDLPLLAASVGHQLAAFGLLLGDSTDEKLFRASRLSGVTVS